MRAVIHFRIESFFASIEAKRRPELAGKPLMVAKNSGNTSGIVVSASREARSFGACEGLTVRHAQRLCPDAVFVAADYALYRSVSSAIMDIFSGYSPLLEPDSLDGAWMDVTASRKLFGGPRRIASESIAGITAMGYRAAAGIASNKLVAQVASSTALSTSNHSVMLVPPGREQEFLATLPVTVLPGVGEKTSKRLLELGVKSIGQIAVLPDRLLSRQFGLAGDKLHRLSTGVDHSQVKAVWPPEIIKIEHMFPDPLAEPSEVEAELGPLSDRLALELRSQNRLAEIVELRVASAEAVADHFSVWKLKRPVNMPGDIFFALRRLLPLQMHPEMEADGVSVRLSGLTAGDGLQLCLMGDSERRRKLDIVMESVHTRFGNTALLYASSLAAAGRESVLSRVSA